MQIHVIEVSPGTKAEGTAPFGKKATDIYFPAEAAQDFPVAMQISSKYNMIYMVTKVRAASVPPPECCGRHPLACVRSLATCTCTTSRRPHSCI